MEDAEGLARELEAEEQLNSLGYIDIPCKKYGISWVVAKPDANSND